MAPIDFSDDLAAWIGPDAEFSEQIEYFQPADAAAGKTIWSLLLEEFETEVDTPRGRYRATGREIRIIASADGGIAAPERGDKIRAASADYVVMEVNGPHEGMHWLRCRRAMAQHRGDPGNRRAVGG